MGNSVSGGENGVNKLLVKEAGVEGIGSSRSIRILSKEIRGESRNSRLLIAIVNIKNNYKSILHIDRSVKGGVAKFLSHLGPNILP